MKSKLIVFTVLLLLMCGTVYFLNSGYFSRSLHGPILHEETSQYSKIRVRGNDSERHLLFVSDAGREQLQSAIDLQNPGELQVPYTRTMFASQLVHYPQNRMLVIGLGGGGMIRFVNQKFPESTVIEAVEIDPAVVRIAAEFFETQENERVIIHTEDAFEFLRRTGQPLYDAIYMDAFLRPSVDSDVTGKTARLKTVAFLEDINTRLVPEGVLVCNLFSSRKTTPGDIEALRQVFPLVKIVPTTGAGNLIVIAGKKKIERTQQEWIEVGKNLEELLPVGLPFAEYAGKMR